jgi:hypothetical protein
MRRGRNGSDPFPGHLVELHLEHRIRSKPGDCSGVGGKILTWALAKQGQKTVVTAGLP